MVFGTWNTRGILGKLETIHELMTMPVLSKSVPVTNNNNTHDKIAALFLTETLLPDTRTSHPALKRLRNALPVDPSTKCKARTFFSSTPDPDKELTRRQRDGVCAIISSQWANKVKHVPNKDSLLLGRALTLDFSSTPTNPPFLRVIGIYMPTHSHKPGIRNAMYAFLQREAQLAAATNPPYRLLICGDINAALQNNDRSSGRINNIDRGWARFVCDFGLSPIDAIGHPRPHTWVSHDGTLSSRIDDFVANEITLPSVCNHLLNVGPVLSHIVHDSDHHPLLAALDTANILPSNQPLPPPQTPDPMKNADTATPHNIQPPAERFKLPIKPSQLQRFQQKYLCDYHPAISQLHSHICALLRDPASLHNANNVISSIDHEFKPLQEAIHYTALQTCDTISTNARIPPAELPHRHNTQPTTPPKAKNHDNRFLPRDLASQYKKLLTNASKGRKAIAQARSTNDNWATCHYVKQLAEICNLATPTPTEANTATPPQTWIDRIKTIIRKNNNDARSTISSFNKKLRQKESRKLANKLFTNRKQAHKDILNADTDTPTGIDKLLSRDGKLLTHTDAILSEAATQYASTVSPVPEPTYHSPTDILPPWSAQYQAHFATGDLDPFTLRTAKHEYSNIPHNTTLASLLDKTCFMRCLRSTPNKRAPGPDHLPNEFLKHMPQEFLDMLFDLFRLQLHIGRTCPSWKTSLTTLIHKKDDPTVLSNYRPIGLANTTYKLWTSCITDALSRYCSHAGILSDSQSGFRPKRRCLQQLLSLTGAIEDSKRSGTDLYITYIDFANAFGSVDHIRLASVMNMLGIPQDAITTVIDLYTDADTRLRLPGHGMTRPIPLKRGTIQGDCLSPLLFLLYMEPLLQWLEVGKADGYAPKCSNETDLQCENLLTNAFADDLALISQTLCGMRRMLLKLELYSKWAKIQVNASKCAFTGRESSATSLARRTPLADCTMTINNNRLPFLPPEKPYKYLGIMITLKLDACTHYEYLSRDIKHRISLIRKAPLTDIDFRLVIETLVISKIEYTLQTGILCRTQIDSLQTLLYPTLIKEAYGVTCNGCPREVLHFQPETGGLGIPNLQHINTASAVAAYELALNDPGRLGRFSRALVSTILRKYDYDLSTIAGMHHKHNPSLWIRRIATILNAKLGLHAAPLITSPPVGTEDAYTQKWNAASQLEPRAAERANLYHTTSLLREIGITCIDQVTGNNGLMPLDELKVYFPQLTKSCTLAYRTMYEYEAINETALRLFWQPLPAPPETTLPNTNFSILENPTATVTYPTAPITTNPPFHSNTYLFPDIISVIDKKRTPAGASQYLIQWAPGSPCKIADANHPDIAPLIESRSDNPAPSLRSKKRRRGQIVIHWKPHWCQENAYICSRQAIVDFNKHFHNPPPPLGHSPTTPNPNKHNLNILFDEINPDFDTIPTGRSEMRLIQNEIYIHDASGHTRGILPLATVTALWQRYHTTLSKNTNPADDTPTQPFADELVMLLQRYRNFSTTENGHRINLKNHWATPSTIMQALRTAFNVTTEMFASPLNVNDHNPTYFSAHRRDTIFGATHDAYSGPWKGAIQFNPEYEADDLLKAVRWAKASAITAGETPFLAVGVLPKWSNKAFQKQLESSPLCHAVATIPRGYFNFRQAKYYPTKTADPPPEHGPHPDNDGSDDDEPTNERYQHAHWPVQIWIVSNEAGRQKYINRTAGLQNLETALLDHMASVKPCPPNTSPTTHLASIRSKLKFHGQPPPTVQLRHKDTRWSARFKQTHFPAEALGDTITTSAVATSPLSFQPQIPPPPPQLTIPIDQLPLAYNAKTITYTDASKKPDSPGIGIGIVSPKPPTPQQPTNINYPPPLTENTSLFVPGGAAHIVKGELLAIWWAIKNHKGSDHDELHILTDSLTSLYMINRCLHCPWTLSSPYESLVTEIVQMATARPGPTIIQKVRAHIGVTGNEEADKLAKAGLDLADEVEYHIQDVPLETYLKGKIYVCLPPQTDEQQNDTNKDNAEEPPSTMAPETREAATRARILLHCTKLMTTNASTHAGKNLALAAKDPHWGFTTESHDLLHMRGKGRLWKNKRKNVLECRYGCFFGQSRKVTIKMIPDTPGARNCRLCGGGPDTGYHTLGPCAHPTIKQCQTVRHHKIAHKAAAKIRQGEHGGCLLLLNAGRTHDTRTTPDDERAPAGPQNTVPTFILPGCTLLPDLLLIIGWMPPIYAFDGTTNTYNLSLVPAHLLPKPNDPNITLVYGDIKICRDTGVLTTIANNAAHYKELMQQIRNRGWRVLGQNVDGTISDTAENMITIPFGNTGLNYRGTIPAVKAFGVTRTNAQRLQKEATQITTDWATIIINQKRLLERTVPLPQSHQCHRNSNTNTDVTTTTQLGHTQTTATALIQPHATRITATTTTTNAAIATTTQPARPTARTTTPRTNHTEPALRNNTTPTATTNPSTTATRPVQTHATILPTNNTAPTATAPAAATTATRSTTSPLHLHATSAAGTRTPRNPQTRVSPQTARIRTPHPPPPKQNHHRWRRPPD
jgi:hypothetical protein